MSCFLNEHISPFSNKFSCCFRLQPTFFDNQFFWSKVRISCLLTSLKTKYKAVSTSKISRPAKGKIIGAPTYKKPKAIIVKGTETKNTNIKFPLEIERFGVIETLKELSDLRRSAITMF